MCMYKCLYAYVCTMCMPGTYESQKKVSDPLEPELKAVMSHCLGTRNQT